MASAVALFTGYAVNTADAAAMGPLPAVHLSQLFSDVAGLFGSSSARTPRERVGSAAGRAHQVAASKATSGAGTAPVTGTGQVAEYSPAAAKTKAGASGKARTGFNAKTSTRLAAKSSAFETDYQNTDGSITRRLYSQPVNYKTPAGYEPIDSSLAKGADGRWYEKANAIGVSFAGASSASLSAMGWRAAPSAHAKASDGTSSGAGTLAAVSFSDSESVSWSLAGAGAVAGTVSGSTAEYDGILPDTNLMLSTTASGVKESLVLTSASAATTWVFPLALTGLSLQAGSANDIDLVDASGTVVASLPAAYAFDSNADAQSGESATTYNVTYAITSLNGVPAVSMTLDSAWLTDPARVFPVTVDPTIVSIAGNAADSAYVDAAYPNQNYGGDPKLKVGYSGSELTESFLSFPTSGSSAVPVNDGYHVSAASLTLYQTWQYTCPTESSEPTSIVSAGSSWSSSSITWNNQPQGQFTLGTLSAAPNSSACSSGLDSNTATGQWVSASLDSNAFNDWSLNSASFYGIGLFAPDSSNTSEWKKFDSSEVASYSPYLSITDTPDTPPQVDSQSPANNATLSTLTPELIATAHDPDAWPSGTVAYVFSIYSSAGGSPIVTSGSTYMSSGDWTVPAGKLSWGKTYQWTVAVFDGWTSTTSSTYVFSTVAPPPLLTDQLSLNEGHGFDAAIGNYTTSATDARVAGVGPSLAVTRDYNSLDPRLSGAFGAGWSSLVDARATQVLDSAGNTVEVVVTYPDGQQVGFGRNADGSFSPPEGRYATLKAVAPGYALTDKSGTTYRFGQTITAAATGVAGMYAISQETDHAGRYLSFAYNTSTGLLSTITSQPAGRTLSFTWATAAGGSYPHVTAVVTNAAAGAGTDILWSYTYSGDQLGSVCPPSESNSSVASTACTQYSYEPGSQYQSAVSDLDPASYWPLTDPGSGTASSAVSSVVLANAGSDNGVYHNVTDPAMTNGSQAAGPLAGSSAPLAGFAGSDSVISLPSVTENRQYISVALWFNTTASGVLFSSDSNAAGAASPGSGAMPILYVGTNGRLYGHFWNGGVSGITSSAAVNDGHWHFVVLSGASDSQTMYLDGVKVGSLSGTLANLDAFNLAGAGVINQAGFLGTPVHSGNAWWYYSGLMSDLAVYDRALTSTDAANLYAIGKHASSLLTAITRPLGSVGGTPSAGVTGSAPYASAAYDTVTGRVTSVTDQNGGVWKVGAPAASGSSEVFRSAVLATGPRNYWRLNDAAGAADATDQVVSDGTGALYNNVTLGADAGPFADGTTAAGLGSSYVRLPTGLLPTNTSGASESIGLWFKTTTNGPILDERNQAVGIAASHSTPSLYVGSDGKLHGAWYAGSTTTQILSPGTVTDGAWHYVILTGGGSSQSMYLDGKLAGTATGAINNLDQSTVLLGWSAGDAFADWADRPANAYFTGDLAEVSFWLGTVSDAQMSDIWHAYKNSNGVVPVVSVTVENPLSHTVPIHNGTGYIFYDDTYEYDPLHGMRQIAYTDPLGATTTYGYDTTGYPYITVDPDGDVTVTGNDVRGNVVSKVTCQHWESKDCSTQTYTYYPDDTTAILSTLDPRDDKVLTSTDALNNKTTYTYNTNGDITETDAPATTGCPAPCAAKTTYTNGTTAQTNGIIAPAELVASTTTPTGAVTRYTYTAGGDLATVISPLGEGTTYTDDLLGRVTSKAVSWTDPNNNAGSATTSYTYDGQNRVLTTTAPTVADAVTSDSHTPMTTDVYDGDGNLTSQTVSDSVAGGDAARATSYTYNQYDQKASQTTNISLPGDTGGNTTSYTYDALGDLVTITDPLQNVTQKTYDPDGRLLTTSVLNYAGDGVHGAGTLVQDSRAYTPAGRLASETDADGGTTYYAYYDNGLTYQIGRTASTCSDTTLTAALGDSSCSLELSETDSYDADGNLTRKLTNNNVTETDYTYDAADRTATETLDPSGVDRTTTYTRDAVGNATGTVVSDTAGTTSQVAQTYDLAGDVLSKTVTATSSTILVTTWVYDTRGLPESMKDPAGNTTYYTYDAAGQLTTTTSPTAPVTTYSASSGTATTSNDVRLSVIGYDTFGEKRETENAYRAGSETVYGYNADGTLASTAPPTYTPPGSSTPITATTYDYYDADGHLTKTVDGAGNATQYTYDQLGRRSKVTAANGGVTSYVYDSVGDVLQQTDATGAQTVAVYDLLGRKVSSTQVERHPTSSNSVTTYGYGLGGWLSSTTTQDGDVTSYKYDNVGEQTSVTDGAGDKTSYTYDGAGRVVKTTLPDNTYTTATYDQAGRQTDTTQYDASGNQLSTTAAAYDADGNVISTTDANGFTTTYTYDPTGLLTSQVEPNIVLVGTLWHLAPITTSYGYDLAGNQTSYTDGNGNTTYYTLNTWGLRESTVLPAAGAYTSAADRTYTISYNGDGKPVVVAEPGGVSEAATYDSVGDLAVLSGSGAGAPTAGVSYGYDLSGRVTSASTTATASATATSESYTYDDRGDLLTASGSAGSSSFTYNGDGLMSSRTDASGTAAYTYDTDDRLATLTDGITGTALTYAYNADSQPSSITYGSGGDVQSYTYYPNHLLQTDTLATPGTSGTTLASISYGYDLNGNLTSKTTTGVDGASSNTYTYDQTNRLTSWQVGSATATRYAYDNDSNRTQVGSNAYTYNARDELTSDGTNTYTYTPNGDLAAKTTSSGASTSYAYDAYGQQANAGSTTYTYDAAGRVVTAAAGSTSTALAYSGTGNLVASDGAGVYSRGPSGALVGTGTLTTSASASPSGTTSITGGVLVLTDRHSDVIGQFTATGTALTGSSSYDPTGNLTATTGMHGDLGYQSEYTSTATGQVNMASRWYNPATGQFASRDSATNSPVPASANANPFAYANASPLDGTDPTGQNMYSVTAPDGGYYAGSLAALRSVAPLWDFETWANDSHVSLSSGDIWQYWQLSAQHSALEQYLSRPSPLSLAHASAHLMSADGMIGSIQSLATLVPIHQYLAALGGFDINLADQIATQQQAANQVNDQQCAPISMHDGICVHDTPGADSLSATIGLMAGGALVGAGLAAACAATLGLACAAVGAAGAAGETMLMGFPLTAEAAGAAGISGAGAGTLAADEIDTTEGTAAATAAAAEEAGAAADLTSITAASTDLSDGLTAETTTTLDQTSPNTTSDSAPGGTTKTTDNAPTPETAPAQTTTAETTTTPTDALSTAEPAPTSGQAAPVLFGQARVSPYFSAGGAFKGASVYSVAEALRVGDLGSDDVVVHAFRYEGALVTENNRSLTALSMAGMRPTNIEIVPATRKLLERLDEVGPTGDVLPSTRIAITPSMGDYMVLDVVNIPGYN